MNKLMTLWMVLLLATTPAAAQAEKQLEAARHKEVVDGDLKAAADQYRKIAAQFAKQPDIAARALYQLGQVQEKLGQAEARKSYERIVKEYASADQYAAQARARLAALGGAATIASGGMSLRRLDSRPAFSYMRGVSSDGRWIAFSLADDGGSQGLYDTVTRQEKIVVPLDWTGEVYGAGPSLSRDGKWLAFATYKNQAMDAELRVVRADGTGLRTLCRLTGKSWVIPKDWTPDGRHVLAQLDADGEQWLSLISVSDGTQKRLVRYSGADRHAFISPDGARVAYTAKPGSTEEAESTQTGTIRIIGIDGAGDRELLPSLGQGHLMGWAPNGKGLIVLSRKSGEPGLWLVPLAGGNAGAGPKLLRTGMPWNAWPAGLTSTGSLYFVEDVDLTNSFLLRLDAGAGEQARPAPVTSKFQDANSRVVWSPDGQTLAWFGRAQSGWLIHIRDIASGRERAIAFPAAPNPRGMRWLTDNRTIICGCGGNPGAGSLCAFDTQSGESRLFMEKLGFYSISPDGRFVYSVREEFRALHVFDAQTKTGKVLAQLGGRSFNIEVSPDGRYVACVVRKGSVNSLAIIDATTGQMRDLGVVKASTSPNARGNLAWMPDGSGVVMREASGIVFIPLSGAPARTILPVERPEQRIYSLAISPDGKTLSYTQGSTRHDLWALENFLPTRD